MLKRQGLAVIGAVIALFILLHIIFAPEAHTARTTIGTMFGGIAFILMSSSVILSTRLSIFEDFFGGLDRIYQVHRIAGTFAAVFALVHFFGVPKELPEGVDPALNPLVPSAPLGMLSLIFLVLALFIALNRKISYSRWRPTHRIMALVYFFVIGHFMNAPGIFFERFSASGILLILIATLGMVALIYSLFGMNRQTSHRFKLEAVNPLERATELVLKSVDKSFEYKPGQFAFIEIQGKGWNEPHPFTISSAPSEDGLRFTIKVLGDWTRKIREELKPGITVFVRGPYGRFDPTKGGDKQVWIAGGIGLTPFLSAMRAMKPGDKRQITFIYAARDEKDAIFLDELKEKAEKVGNVNLVPLYSNEGHFARIDVIKQKLLDSLDSYEYFLCGPKPMVDGFVKDLQKENLPRDKLHAEAFEFR